MNVVDVLITLRPPLMAVGLIGATYPLWHKLVLKPQPKAADPIVFWGAIGVGAVLVVVIGLTELDRYTDRLQANLARANPFPRDFKLEPETEECPPCYPALPPPVIKTIEPDSRWWSCSW